MEMHVYYYTQIFASPNRVTNVFLALLVYSHNNIRRVLFASEDLLSGPYIYEVILNSKGFDNTKFSLITNL